jgi:hypothetical protein
MGDHDIIATHELAIAIDLLEWDMSLAGDHGRWRHLFSIKLTATWFHEIVLPTHSNNADVAKNDNKIWVHAFWRSAPWRWGSQR